MGGATVISIFEYKGHSKVHNGLSLKFKVISKRKFIAKWGGEVCGPIHFWTVPAKLIFKILTVQNTYFTI